MNFSKTFSFILLTLLLSACENRVIIKEKDKIFHAGPVNGGFGVIFFSLYKDNKYKFCDGDFMEPGCYAGYYRLSGDTIVLNKLKKHNGIPTNLFIIRRYKDMDSSYWQWKYPDHKDDWQIMRQNDSLIGSTGDVFPLDSNAKIIFDRNTHFIIRLDSLEYNF